MWSMQKPNSATLDIEYAMVDDGPIKFHCHIIIPDENAELKA